MKYTSIDLPEFHFNRFTCPQNEKGKATVTAHFLHHLTQYMLEHCEDGDEPDIPSRVQEIIFVNEFRNPRLWQHSMDWLIVDLLQQLADSRDSVHDYEWKELFLDLKKKIGEKE